MNPRVRVIAIIAVIAVPLLFFLVFRPLSKVPRPKAPRPLFAKGVDQYGDSVFHKVPHFKLQTHLGDTLDSDSLLGNIYVLDFFFTTCPGVCPRMTQQMVRVQKNFIKDKNIKLLSVSVDEEKDTVGALKTYADAHGAVPGKWYFLRGSKQEIFELAQKGFFVTAKEDDGPEDFIHSEKFILVDYDGHIRGYYNGLDSISVNKLMADMVLLLRDIEKGYSFRKDPNKKARIKDLF
ncbi:MAG: SCO family protein [Chitinophagales bacterium]|nr:SCO family protein [Chitinophagales bacterium]MDW8273370.1 SCO family protein [Chitinophagales bacterium]